jgi:hypothetical protein
VAGVFGIEDNLEVGDPSIRQQVVDVESTRLLSKSTTSVAQFRDPFRHLPVLSQSLDDMLVGSAASVVHAS